jgi:hypothetical protein
MVTPSNSAVLPLSEVWTRKPKSFRQCHIGTGASVARVPEPRPEMSHSYRSHRVKYLPGLHTVRCQTVAKSLILALRAKTSHKAKGPDFRAFSMVAGAGFEPATFGL